ncbi:MAG: phosphoribosyl-AMP cyclohydrolase [Patescibacteria group bacterium]|nr:phosphoribosyl-AMP cyclohydrolase [Patescibacteria group bacterium]
MAEFPTGDRVMKVCRPRFEKRGGVIPVVVQEDTSRDVLMLAYTDEAGYLETLKSGEVVLFSTSKNARWKKGETSGNVLKLIEARIDCDGDALVYLVQIIGPGVACHTHARTCFYRNVFGNKLMPAPQEGDNEKIAKIEAPVHRRLEPPVRTQGDLPLK